LRGQIEDDRATREQSMQYGRALDVAEIAQLQATIQELRRRLEDRTHAG
jgi:hypothetical protein